MSGNLSYEIRKTGKKKIGDSTEILVEECGDEAFKMELNDGDTKLELTFEGNEMRHFIDMLVEISEYIIDR